MDATATVGPRSGPLLRWLGAGWGLEQGPGLGLALDELDLSRLPDGRMASAFWLRLEGEQPAGTSADLVVAAVALLRARLATQISMNPALIVTGAGSVGLDQAGRPRVLPVEGWPEKIAALAARLEGLAGAEALLLCPVEQSADVSALLAARGLEGRAQICPVAAPSELHRALRGLLGGAAPGLEGWPPAAEEARRLLERAQVIAEQGGLGYLGVEHVALALVESGAAGPTIEQMRRFLAPASLRPVLTGVVLVNDDPGLTPTPRLGRVAAALDPHFEPEQLAATLTADPGSVLHVLAGCDLGAVVPRMRSEILVETALGQETDGPPFLGGLEVLGGPEDGRPLWLSPGETLGRWAPQGAPSVSLYERSRLRDRLLSRVHLEMSEGGRVLVRRPIRMLVHGLERVVEAGSAVEPGPGQVLRLTPFTWLLTTARPQAV